jgi:hypothetical protein
VLWSLLVNLTFHVLHLKMKSFLSTREHQLKSLCLSFVVSETIFVLRSLLPLPLALPLKKKKGQRKETKMKEELLLMVVDLGLEWVLRWPPLSDELRQTLIWEMLLLLVLVRLWVRGLTARETTLVKMERELGRTTKEY